MGETLLFALIGFGMTARKLNRWSHRRLNLFSCFWANLHDWSLPSLTIFCHRLFSSNWMQLLVRRMTHFFSDLNTFICLYFSDLFAHRFSRFLLLESFLLFGSWWRTLFGSDSTGSMTSSSTKLSTPPMMSSTLSPRSPPSDGVSPEARLHWPRLLSEPYIK